MFRLDDEKCVFLLFVDCFLLLLLLPDELERSRLRLDGNVSMQSIINRRATDRTRRRTARGASTKSSELIGLLFSSVFLSVSTSKTSSSLGVFTMRKYTNLSRSMEPLCEST